MNVCPVMPGGGNSPCLPELILVVAAAVLSAQNDAWANALGTASAVCTVIVTCNRERRS